MKTVRFEDMIAGQKAQDLAISNYKHFEASKNFGFRDQLQKAEVSISNNIAGGFESNSDKEFSRFLHIALSSCSEVKFMPYLAERLNYLTNDQTLTLIDQTN
jgi:four helix bundle protein